MNVLEVSQQMDKLLNLFIHGEVDKDTLEDKRKELYESLEEVESYA